MDTTEKTAGELHADSVARYNAARDAGDQAEAALVEATAGKAALVASIVDGADVSTMQLRVAESRIKETEESALLAKAVREGSKRRMDEAQISFFADTAKRHIAARGEALVACAQSAREVDKLVAATQAALQGHFHNLAKFDTAVRSATHHDSSVESVGLGANSVLQAMQHNSWPLCRVQQQVQRHEPISAELRTRYHANEFRSLGSLTDHVVSRLAANQADLAMLANALADATPAGVA